MSESLSTEVRFMRLLRRLRRVGPEQEPPFEAVGITSAQLALLEWAASHPGCSMQDMADGLGLTPPTVSVGVRRLEEVGVLERHPDPKDGRAWQLELTAAGTALWARVQRYRGEKTRRLLGGLAPEEQQTLLALLERALDGAEKDLQQG